MAKIQFEAKVSQIGDSIIIKIPKNESTKLPSRGIVIVEGTINNFPFQRELEPDGQGSHFLELNPAMMKKAKLNIGDSTNFSIEPSKEWPEPDIPEDLKKALKENDQAQKTWEEITPMARWDWIRWIRSTKNLDTRKIRIQKTFSKFKAGIKRPCCFNRTECTIPELSNKGKLLNPI